ncbi:uncharacterized protein LOC126330066 [Schistocerca gregaria]|uniref:uncharacterized protein LOC126330066 n=1 Tax=Schistocerca gregaria TaxID=7010 RepID=UPI00211E2C1B|nr:uncharacterized protein LOC126330066 [Schistocerca gregaria]
MTNSRENNIYLAKIAEQAERFDEMAEAMKAVAAMEVDLTVEERNLFSVAYKNVVGARRSSWRMVSGIEQRDLLKGSEEHVKIVRDYRKKIEKELESICYDVLEVLNKHIVPYSVSRESNVFFKKMCGDYFRYLAEIKSPNDKDRADVVSSAGEAYQCATDIAKEFLPTHPIRLGLALNYSVYYYEIIGDSDKACFIARKAFEDAMADLDSLSEDSYKDSTVIMQLLRDNLTLWTTDMTGDAEKDEDEKPRE